MQFEQRYGPAIADGSLTLTFHRLADLDRRLQRLDRASSTEPWALGLTLSVRLGYRLSPRGEAYLRLPPPDRASSRAA
jgi:hypothetical protein